MVATVLLLQVSWIVQDIDVYECEIENVSLLFLIDSLHVNSALPIWYWMHRIAVWNLDYWQEYGTK